MKSKLTGLASAAILLLSPVMGAFNAVAPVTKVQASSNWDYDTNNPSLGEYDRLLQNAGPSDGIVDWYPARNALGANPSGQDLVKQLIELSIATNNVNSNARSVLFNDTTGTNNQSGYEETYNKYKLAYGFIAQLLDFNNAKTGLGAKLKQGAVAGEDPVDPRTNESVIEGAVTKTPGIGEGHTIADILGRAFFGEADEAYAQIYLNGYDNTIQNEANIIREGTSSITIVAQSKLTGKKATAIFKLNNKTVPTDIKNSKLNNYVDRSSYALDDKDGNGDIAGLNMTTASQNTIDNIKFSKESTFWVDNKNGGGTIVVPRGTSAKQIAELISQKQIEGNNTLAGTAPMKAIQAASTDGTKKIAGASKTWKEVSYSHFYEGTQSNKALDGSPNGTQLANSAKGSPNDREATGEFNFADVIACGVNGPENFDDNKKIHQYREYNNVFNSDKSAADGNKNAVKLTNEEGKDGWFGGKEYLHMIDTNALFSSGEFISNKSAASLPNVGQSEGTPWDDDGSLDHARNMGIQTSKVAGVSDPKTLTNVGKVKHLFKPKNYFKEAYDANHFVNNSPEIQDKNVDALSQKLANNGSFSNTSSEGQVKKSFTYEAPVTSWLYKSYNNPYSTVMSSAGAQTTNGEKIDEANRKNSTIQPQKVLDLDNPNNPDVKGNDTNTDTETQKHLDPGKAYVQKLSNATLGGATLNGKKVYFYAGTFSQGSLDSSKLDIKFDGTNDTNGVKGTISLYPGKSGTLVKYGAIGTDGENKSVSIGENGKQKLSSTNPSNISSSSFNNDEINLDSANYNINNNYTSAVNLTINDNKLKKIRAWDDSQYFVQTWDKNTHIKKDNTPVSDPNPLIYNKNVDGFGPGTLGQVDSPNFESKYYVMGYFVFEPIISSNPTQYQIKAFSLNDHLAQTAASKRAYFNSNLYNNPNGAFANLNKNGDSNKTENKTENSSRFFVSQDFSIGPVSRDMISDAGPAGSDVTIGSDTYPAQNTDDASAEQILKLAVMYNNPEKNVKNKENGNAVKSRFTDSGKDVNGEGNDGTGYKLVSIADAANKQGVSEDALANEVAKVTGKSAQEVKNTKWVQATLPRLRKNAGSARINVVVYDPDKAAVPAPSKPETKPSFSTTDVYQGNDPFKVNLRPYTTVYDDGAVLKVADVPQSFKNLLNNTLVTGNSDLINNPSRLQQVLVSAFLNSWQQNDGSFDQTDSGAGVNSPLYLYGGFGISNSDSKNSYSQWPNGYATNTGDYLEATSNFSEDFYRGGKDLQLVRGGKVKGIPTSSLKADVSKVDLSKAGTYPVVYTYTNPSNSKDTAKITVPVTVKGAAAPVFAFQGGSDVTIHVGDSFDRNAYKVVGNWDIFNKYNGDYNKLANGEGIAKDSQGNLEVTITGDVDTSTPGIYQVTYEATNLAGAKTKLVRNINVLPNKDSNKPEDKDWTVIAMKGVGYINYVPGYGINVWNAPHGIFTGQRLLHATAWKISQKAVNSKGEVYYCVGKNQWIDGQYVSFSPVSSMQALKGMVTINYVPGYGVNLWKSASTTGGYYDRKLAHGSKWKVMGQENGFYNVGKNQWIQAKYAKFQAR